MAGRAVRGVEDLLAAARGRIERLEPEAAWRAATAGEALIVDIRADDVRRREGIIAGSLHIPRDVLEWRVDPASGSHNPHVGGRARRLVLVCSHGCSSTLAAAVLRDLGFDHSGDVTGGFEAWRRAGLPVVPAPETGEGGLRGMGGPDTTSG